MNFENEQDNKKKKVSKKCKRINEELNNEMKTNKNNIATDISSLSSVCDSNENNLSSTKMMGRGRKVKNKEKNKKVSFKEDEITSESLINYFIESYDHKINIENDELCQILTGKRFYDIERLAKNNTEITHYSIMNKNIQKEKENYCKNCGYVYNYDDYTYMYIKYINLLKMDDKEAAYNTIKCIYCGVTINDIELQNKYNDKEYHVELLSYREKYLFDKKKKLYWKNKITSFDKNTSLFKEEKNNVYNITYEKCVYCGNDFLHFINIQTRSADEGSTIIYFCPNCKKQTSVNN